MITKISINNINSIDNITLSFDKDKYKYLDTMIFNTNYVNPIAIYGTNGSGKTSLLFAISTLISLLTSDINNLSPFTPNFINVQKKIDDVLSKRQKINNFNKFYSKIKSSLELSFIVNDTIYSYYIETNNTAITKEYLKEKNKIVFNRYKNFYVFNKNKINISESLYPTLRLLSNEGNKNKTINTVFEYLSNIAYIDASRKHYLINSFNKKTYLDVLVEYSPAVKKLLKKYKEFPIYLLEKQINELGQQSYFLNINKNDKDTFKLPIELMSAGMQNNSFLLSTILSLPKNGTLILDELDQALHPTTIHDFLNIVKEKNIQLIFTSHNTNLLQKLRPDQIFFAHWQEGFSTYKKLSNIYQNIREVNNIEKMYLSSMFDDSIKQHE